MEHHSVAHWFWFLFVGGVIGWLAGQIVRGRGFGVIGDIIVGIVGAMLGGWMARVLGIYTGSSLRVLLVALGGAVVLVAVTRLVKRDIACNEGKGKGCCK